MATTTNKPSSSKKVKPMSDKGKPAMLPTTGFSKEQAARILMWTEASRSHCVLEAEMLVKKMGDVSGWKKSGRIYDVFFEELHDASPLARAVIVRQGVQPALLPVLADDLGVTRDTLFSWSGLARTTVNRKVTNKQSLTPAESESAIAIASLLGQVTKIVKESGTIEGFDAGAWLGRWLSRPHAALGGVPPGTLLDTNDGRAVVSSLLDQLQTGAYA